MGEHGAKCFEFFFPFRQGIHSAGNLAGALRAGSIEKIETGFDPMTSTPLPKMIIPSRGDFSFIKDNETRIMFEDAYKAIESVWAGWEFVERDPGEGGFMFSTSLIAVAIQKNMKYEGHSGASYGWTMRKMQHLARIGWEAFVKEEHTVS
jgi:hypothetical protein